MQRFRIDWETQNAPTSCQLNHAPSASICTPSPHQLLATDHNCLRIPPRILQIASVTLSSKIYITGRHQKHNDNGDDHDDLVVHPRHLTFDPRFDVGGDNGVKLAASPISRVSGQHVEKKKKERRKSLSPTNLQPFFSSTRIINKHGVCFTF